MSAMPQWSMPANLADLVEDEGGEWQDGRWSPLVLSVMSDTEYEGRDIPLAWQVSFEIGADWLEPAEAREFGADASPDGYDWYEAIRDELLKRHPDLTPAMHDDSESSTFVMWAENEVAGRALTETVWSMTQP